MHIPSLIRRVTLSIGALLLVTACAGGTTAGWTFAPLGPSANPTEAASGAPSSPSSSGGAGPAINLETTGDQPLVFNPADFSVPAGSTVTVTYLNNSNLPHNVNIFNGADNSAPSLGASTVETGPSATETVTFTAPTQPGDYFFWCDVHQNAMKGVWHVQ